MTFKQYVITTIAIACVFFLLGSVFFDSSSRETNIRGSDPNGGRIEELLAVTKLLIEQRNNLSRQLNLKQQNVGQMQCEKLGDAGESTSETGGWCMKSSKEGTGNHMTDKSLVNALIEFFQGKYVGSFGDGPGRYKQLLTDSGKLKGYDAYDGAPFCETTSEGRVKFLDLTLPQYGLPLYDWIMSLEVAEHIPIQFESVYIDNIIRHAKEGVLISWARPGQGGYSHVNNRPFEYVKALMEKHGFTYDEKESVNLRQASTFDWFKHNINVFRRNIKLTETMHN